MTLGILNLVYNVFHFEMHCESSGGFGTKEMLENIITCHQKRGRELERERCRDTETTRHESAQT
jgi:hypothetical protein